MFNFLFIRSINEFIILLRMKMWKKNKLLHFQDEPKYETQMRVIHNQDVRFIFWLLADKLQVGS